MSFNLKERQGVVQSFWSAVNHGGELLNDLPRIVRVVIESDAWREREVDGQVVEHKRFIDFITEPPRRGCGWPPEKVQRLISHDAYVDALWRETITPAARTRTDLLHDNIIQSEQGTSRSYTVSRLKQQYPELFARVVAGELSANAAAIEAGFRKKPTPFEQIVKLIPKLTDEQRQELVLILNH